ncbi:Molybdopterin biosynthesis protein [Phaffia rhodozyma]|uniref:Molybdopterin biosynthesis protein n=1 Tax=Phaffia rhodozyma TaxID=264483 RepID=A0A0F7SFJ0_PHARH|nr:Molybdopterin biosynthesis protein [Phaffia rhodozyma]
MSTSRYRAAVLTVSDTAAAAPHDLSLDTTGPYIRSQLIGIQGLFASDHMVSQAVVSDSEDDIRKIVRTWADEGVDLVITTGGTGWGARDVTVQALAPLFSKHLPALSQAITAYGLSKTPLASLSNPICGLISPATRLSRTLVVALPGSKGGVKDGMAVLAPLLLHGLSFLGESPECKTQIESQHGPRTVSDPVDTQPFKNQGHTCIHHSDRAGEHHRHHPKPNTAVSARQRKSPHPLIPLKDAVQIVHDIGAMIGLGTEIRQLDSSLAGYIIAESVEAEHPLPRWHSTNVDGYAVHVEDGPGEYLVRPRGSGLPLQRGQIERVNTGGPIPEGADTVIMVEDTELVSASEAGEELIVRILSSSTKKGANVRLPGSDIPQGEIVMSAGELITRGGGETGVLASVGRKRVVVKRKPKIALLSTGSELINLSLDKPSEAEATINTEAGQWGGIYDSNRPSLRCAAEGMGYEVIDIGVVRDEIGAHEEAMRKALEVADVVITTGGTSMGEGDLVKPLLEHTFKANIHFGRVAMAPGKPTTFASVPNPSLASSSSPSSTKESHGDRIFFALPGNPASALVTFWVFVVPVLRALGGWPEKERGLKPIWVELAHALPKSDRPTYHRCTLSFSPTGLPKVTSTGGQRSSRVASLKRAEVLVLVEAGDSGEVPQGSRVEGLLLPI